MVFFLQLCVFYYVFEQIKDLKSKAQNYTKFYLNPQKKNTKTSSHFPCCRAHQNDDYDVYYQIEDEVIRLFSNLKRFLSMLYSSQISPSSDLK